MKNQILFFFYVTMILMVTCCNSPKSENSQSEKDTQLQVNTKEIEQKSYPETLVKAFQAHGGLEIWHSFGTLEYDLIRAENTEHHLIDLKNRKVLITSEAYEIGFDGSEVWISPNKEAMAGGSPRFYHNLFFYFFSIPLIFSDPGIHFEELGQTELDGKDYSAVKISYDDGIGDSPEDFYIPHFNPETNRMEALLYTVTYRSGETTNNYNALIYDEWQTVQGLVLPASITGYKYENGEIGNQRYAATYKNVLLKKDRPDQAIFEMPEQAEIDSLVAN